MKEKTEIIQSPEQIPDHLHVTYVPTYLLAAAAALLLAAFIVWGVLGNVSDKAYYSGVVFPAQGTTDITLPNKGIVRSMLVHNGDSVHQGQTVAMVSIGDSHSFLTSTVSGLVISTKTDNEPFEAFDPIVSVIDGNATGGQVQHTRLIAYADNEAHEVPRYENGAILSVSSVAFPSEHHPATISAIGPVVDDNGMVHVEATLEPHPHLAPGMTAFITVQSVPTEEK